jgi:peptidoglycan hydrolase-like protein with peptidoglycan-binding domain
VIRSTASILAIGVILAGCNNGYDYTHSGATHVSNAAPMAPAMPAGATALPVSPDTARQIQTALQARGFYKGPIDGVIGQDTQTALANYQQSKGLSRTAALDGRTLQDLAADTAATNNTPSSGSSSAPEQQMSPDQIRAHLQSMGYSPVNNLQADGPDKYSAQALQNGTNHSLEIDSRNGQILSDQQ